MIPIGKITKVRKGWGLDKWPWFKILSSNPSTTKDK
jgi:hypothetical protein